MMLSLSSLRYLSLPFCTIQDSIKCIGDQSLKRISISFGHYSYVTTLGDGFVYIVKVDLPEF